MSDNPTSKDEMVTIQSTRFGSMTVPRETFIEFPVGIVGFPRTMNFIMIEHKAPFCWLHSVEDPELAFVVVDGFEFGDEYDVSPPYGDKAIDLKEDDEFAILVIVTVRSDPRMTTANLKAPLFVNLRTRKGIQVIFDNPKFSTRFPLWQTEEEKEAEHAKKKEE